MPDGVSLAGSELPTEMTGRPGMVRRLHMRGERPEYWFLYDDPWPRIPIWHDSKLQFARWGNRHGQSRSLPPSGWTWLSDIEDGLWRQLEPQEVKIPATFALVNGRWYPIRLGIRAILVPDEEGWAVAYMICEPSSRYYKNMTRSDRMPAVVNDRDRI